MRLRIHVFFSPYFITLCRMVSTKILGRFQMNNNLIVRGFDEERDDTIKIRLQRIDETCVVLYLVGHLDIYNSANTTRRINKIIEAGYRELIADCRQLNFVSSTGVGVLVEALKNTKSRNGNLVLLYLQPKVAEVLDLLGFQSFFTHAEDLDSAISSLETREKKEWPLVFKCPTCNRRLRTSKAGRFRCCECKTTIVVNPEMQVLAG